MPDIGGWESAGRPEDLSRFFVERANAGDVEGLVRLYEPDAVLALATGEVARGEQAIRQMDSRPAQRARLTVRHDRTGTPTG